MNYNMFGRKEVESSLQITMGLDMGFFCYTFMWEPCPKMGCLRLHFKFSFESYKKQDWFDFLFFFNLRMIEEGTIFYYTLVVIKIDNVMDHLYWGQNHDVIIVFRYSIAFVSCDLLGEKNFWLTFFIASFCVSVYICKLFLCLVV